MKRLTAGKLLTAAFILLLGLVFFYPVAASILRSFRVEGQIAIQSYMELFFDCFIFYPMFWNSVLYAGVITLLQLFVIIPCAFGFMYARFRGKNALYIFYIMLMMMPLQVTVLPNYIGLRDMGLLNTRTGIILPMIFAPFGVIVMHQYMKSIDNSIIEATRLDTSSMIRILWTAVVPQLRICIFAVALFVFAECWNMVEQPMLFLKDDRLKTLTIMISQTDTFSPAILSAAAVIFMIPVLLLYMFFNEHLEQGLTLKDLS
ncbi:MAG: carbohydrate ABC transporter permease [Clostridiales bacterium]|nr:carbohydrate ABC transporter permease [Clostridiales bacterium]